MFVRRRSRGPVYRPPVPHVRPAHGTARPAAEFLRKVANNLRDPEWMAD